MSFKDDFPDHTRYNESKYYYSRVPPGLNSALQGLIIRNCRDIEALKAVCADLAARIPTEPTSNWGWEWLVNDLRDYVRLLSQKFHKYMDFILDFADAHYFEDRELVEDLNDAFRDSDFGYSLVLEKEKGESYLYWSLYEEPDVGDDSIEEASIHVKDVSEQAYDHLNQARDQLLKTDNPRAWKDALRDCLSAMEALVNTLGNDPDIKQSTSKLRADTRWGPDVIIKDGLSMWNKMHDLYPDIRHGSSEKTALSREEAVYWIDRLMAFVSYLAKRQKEIGK
jgi:hypothetical protein